MSEIFNLDHLIKSEKQTREETLNKFGDIRTHFSSIINTLFGLIYFFGDTEKPETDRGYYQTMCITHYCQIPYSFWIVNDLTMNGYYLEAIILYRHLMEAFIQIRYFDKYPDQVKKKLLGRKNFKEMFDEFAPGYYKKYYSLLCDAAHGVLLKDLCRFDRVSSPQRRIRMGCELNLKIADYVVCGIVVLLYGYLNKYESIFPKNTISNKPTIYRELTDAKQWLFGLMEDHKKEFTKSREWYIYIDKLIK